MDLDLRGHDRIVGPVPQIDPARQPCTTKSGNRRLLLATFVSLQRSTPGGKEAC
jgi:hypothetical protein